MEQKTSSENLLIERIVQDARSEADAAMAEATANRQRAREDCDARIVELTRAFERDSEWHPSPYHGIDDDYHHVPYTDRQRVLNRDGDPHNHRKDG